MSSKLMQLPMLFGVRGSLATQTMRKQTQKQVLKVEKIVNEVMEDEALAGDKIEFCRQLGLTIGGDYRLILLSIVLVVGTPAIVYFLTRHTIVTITYDETASYGVGLMTGIFNTVKVSALGCMLATVIGFVVGISRLSSNWIVSKLAETYIEVLRNIPLLLQIFFW